MYMHMLKSSFIRMLKHLLCLVEWFGIDYPLKLRCGEVKGMWLVSLMDPIQKCIEEFGKGTGGKGLKEDPHLSGHAHVFQYAHTQAEVQREGRVHEFADAGIEERRQQSSFSIYWYLCM